jgi:2-oxoisovalerate dehydrogenase E1 component
MPKALFVDPTEVRKPEIIKIKDVPVNQYKNNFEKELKTYGKDRLLRILYDMMTIREFENMMNTFKIQGTWNGIEYNHKGPAHLSMGQEASAVGQCVNLDTDDFIFGSHRSHGELLAKCLSAVAKLDESKLESIMKEFLGGDTLRMAEKVPHKNVKDLAENFVLYGALGEIFARSAGFNRGLGGSMHAYFLPFGSMPNNAIVGGSADIATGAALFKYTHKVFPENNEKCFYPSEKIIRDEINRFYPLKKIMMDEINWFYPSEKIIKDEINWFYALKKIIRDEMNRFYALEKIIRDEVIFSDCK